MRSVVALVLVFAVATAYAQSITMGAIQGVVTDADTEQPLVGVTVSVGNQSDITDDHGHYKITEITPGTYDVLFEYATAKVTHEGVVIGANNVASLYQKLKIGE